MPAPRFMRDRARALRKTPTKAEQRLWRGLRELRLSHGLHFRRQHPIGSYIVDFACLKARLIIEVDGGQHAGSSTDSQRDAWLRAQGFEVARFWNSDVLRNYDGVLHMVAALTRAKLQESAP